MRHQKVLTIVVTLSLLLAGSSILATQTSASPVQETTSLFTQIAKDALEAQNQILVSGERIALDSIPAAAAYRDLVQGRTPELNTRREALAENQLVYTSFRTQLTATRVKVKRTKATLWATEQTVFDLESPGGPPSTGYEVEHRFDFVSEDGSWKLTSDEVLDDLKFELPEPGQVPVETPPTRPEKASNEDGDIQIATVTIQRQAIVNYATRYWTNYNPQYRADSNDCTNFASQALYAGGWPMVLGFYQSNSVWWYNFSAGWPGPYHSYTWGGAHNFYWFTYNSNRRIIAQSVSQLQPGDILQADWTGPQGHLPDGTVDHTMVVTGKGTNGEVYLTYHTTNRLNRAFFSDLLRAEPNARWYGWRLYNSFS